MRLYSSYGLLGDSVKQYSISLQNFVPLQTERPRDSSALRLSPKRFRLKTFRLCDNPTLIPFTFPVLEVGLVDPLYLDCCISVHVTFRPLHATFWDFKSTWVAIFSFTNCHILPDKHNGTPPTEGLVGPLPQPNLILDMVRQTQRNFTNRWISWPFATT